MYPRGRRWGKSPRRAWLVIRTDEHEVVQFDGPVLELMTDSRTRFDRRIARLGPDIMAEEFDEERFLRRLREDDPTRGIGDALLDQRNLAGIGNVWKSEGCFLAGIDPWRPVERGERRGGAGDRARGAAADAEVAPAAADTRATSWSSSAPVGPAGAAERGFAPAVRATTTGSTYWCPECQALIRVGHKGADHVAPGNTHRELRGGARARRRHDRVRRAAHCATGRLVLAHDYEDSDERASA